MASHIRSQNRLVDVAPEAETVLARANRPVVETEAEERGWFGRATDWVGGQASDVWDAVSEWGQDVAETAGDVRDVVSGSDLDLEDGVWTGETDLEEVADLLPGTWATAVRADREDDQGARVRMRWDTNADTASAELDDVVLDGLSIAGIETGAIRLQGLRIDVEGVSRTSERADLVGDLTRDPFGRLWNGDDDDGTGPVRIRIAVASAEAADVRMPEEQLAADRLALTGLSVMVASEDGVAFTPDAAVISVDVGTADVSGLSVQGTRVDDLGVQGASAVLSGDDVTTRAASATVSGLSGDGFGLAEGTATDLSAATDAGRVVDADAGALSVRDLAVGDVRLGQGEVTGLDTDATATGYRASADEARVGDLTVTSGGTQVAVGAASATTLGARLDGDFVTAAADSVGARELSVSRGDASVVVGDMALDGVFYDGADLRAETGSASDARLRQGDARATIGSFSAADLRAGATGAGAGRLDVRDVTAGAGDAALVVQSGQAEDLAVTADGGAVSRAALQGVVVNQGQTFVNARDVGATGVSVDAAAGVASADQLTAAGVLADVDRQRVGVDALQIDGVAGQFGQTTGASADRVQASGIGVDVALPAAEGSAGLPTQTVQDLVDRVDDVDLVAQLALQAGEVGPARVQPGTVASVRGTVRDGAIVPGDATGATFSRSLTAGPLGIAGVSGVETRGTRDGGFEVRADAGLFGRHTVSGDRPLSRDLSSLAAEALAPRAPRAAQGTSLSEAVDLDRSALSARATLDGGTVRLPEGSVTLADGERAGDQTVDVSMQGQDRIVAAFVRLLVSGFALETASARVQGGASVLEDAQLRVQDGRASGGIGRIDIGQVSASTR